jgi:hypothetical protein
MGLKNGDGAVHHEGLGLSAVCRKASIAVSSASSSDVASVRSSPEHTLGTASERTKLNAKRLMLQGSRGMAK